MTTGNELTEEHVMILLKNHLKDIQGIKIDWDSVCKIHPNKYIYQLIVDKLSMKFLRKIETIPLVQDVYFFSKVGAGSHGINLLFKVHIVFEKIWGRFKMKIYDNRIKLLKIEIENLQNQIKIAESANKPAFAKRLNIMLKSQRKKLNEWIMLS